MVMLKISKVRVLSVSGMCDATIDETIKSGAFGEACDEHP